MNKASEASATIHSLSIIRRSDPSLRFYFFTALPLSHMRFITFVATVLLFFGFGHPAHTATAQDSRFAETDSRLAEDSTEAASDVMVPYRAELIRAARKHGVPASLLAAFCQEESSFNPWAERTEPAYLANKTVKASAKKWALNHNGIPTVQTELGDRSKFSWASCSRWAK